MTIGERDGPDNSATPGWLALQHQRLDQWELDVGLPTLQVPLIKDEAVRLLELTPDDRRRLSGEELADAAVTLSMYATYLSRLAQREEADAVLLDERVVSLLRCSLANQPAYTPHERRVLALNQSVEARATDLQRVGASVKAKRLAFFAARVDRVAQSYERLAYSRRGERHGQ
jgi:hypothetical protein